jgi:NADP-dependent 3-hydroxy acid dehydrogenase YdfG
MQQTLFITGSSRGLGRAIAGAALDAGDLVVATARQPAQLDDLLAKYGERVHPIGLDVTDAHVSKAAIPVLREQRGGLVMQI